MTITRVTYAQQINPKKHV